MLIDNLLNLLVAVVGFNVDDAAVIHVGDAVGKLKDAGVMGHDDEGAVLADRQSS